MRNTQYLISFVFLEEHVRELEQQGQIMIVMEVALASLVDRRVDPDVDLRGGTLFVHAKTIRPGVDREWIPPLNVRRRHYMVLEVGRDD
jgi:hypothetical protein